MNVLPLLFTLIGETPGLVVTNLIVSFEHAFPWHRSFKNT